MCSGSRSAHSDTGVGTKAHQGKLEGTARERAENIEVLTLDKKRVSDDTCAAWQEERKYLDASYVTRTLTRDAFAIDADGKVVFLYLKNPISAHTYARSHLARTT